MKLIIDGTLISNKDFISGNGNVDSTSITISDADAEGTKIVVGNSLTLSGAAYQIIKTKLIDDPEGVLKFVTAEIYIDDCCENDVLIFSGIIRGDSVDWCEDGCTCDVDLIEDNEDILAMKCIKSTLVSDNYAGFHQQNHPRIVYCIEYRPDILFFFVMTNAWITNLTFSLITPLVAVVSLIYDIIGVIINAINSLLPGDPIGWDETPFNQDSILDAWRELKDRQNQNLIGCGRKHPSPFVRAYIVNVCAKCGLTFESSILNDPQSEYYNTMYFNAPVEKGTRNDNIKYIYENRPLQTLDLFLDSLKTVFNARWDIQGGVLRFERKDFFWNGVADLNYSALKGAGLIKDPLCYKWRSDRRPAFGMFKYAEDGADTCGNEALFRFNGVGEWNQPYNPLQSGHEDIFVPFGVARFRNDGIGGSGFGSATGDPWAEFESMPGIGQTIAQYQGVMILHKHVAFNPRLLIWDGVDGDSARVKADWLTPDQTPFGTYYNFPYSFIPMGINPNTAYPTNHYPGNLYSRFWSINNPKTFPDQGKEWEFSFYYNCESLSIINNLKYILLPIGIGRVTNVSLNSQDQSILISGQI